MFEAFSQRVMTEGSLYDDRVGVAPALQEV